MATYKVIQDIEAEDKLVGPLTLRQFIYAAIASLCVYLSIVAISHDATIFLIVLVPPMLFTAFFAFPWGRDQSTEVWALAKIRYFIKSRKRLWDQSGVKDLVTVTAPKKMLRNYTNGLTMPEVENRLSALASTLDTRGWATKNVYTYTPMIQQSTNTDRLIDTSSLPQNVPAIDVTASEDILDEDNNPRAQRLKQMVDASTASYKQELMERMQHQPTPTQAPANNGQWFVPPSASAGSGILPPVIDVTRTDETVLSHELRERHAQGALASTPQHGKVLQPAAAQTNSQASPAGAVSVPGNISQAIPTPPPATVTPPVDPATIRLAQNDDLTISTIARIANRQDQDADEVVIPLHPRT